MLIYFKQECYSLLPLANVEIIYSDPHFIQYGREKDFVEIELHFFAHYLNT